MGRPRNMRVRVSRWTPDLPPAKPDDLPLYLSGQLTKLSDSLFNINKLHLDRVYAIEDDRWKPLDGDIMLFAADVVAPSPGLYYYDGSAWVFIA